MSDEQNTALAGLVDETIRALYDKGIAAGDLAPLIKLRDAVKVPDAPAAPVAPVAPAAPEADAAQTPPASPTAPGAGGPYNRRGPDTRDARRGEMKASEELMARASAIIDILVQGGQSPEHAAQTITRQLLAVGIELPESGGDVRAWKRLLTWRNNLIHYTRSGVAWDVYSSFKEELTHIPPDKRLRVAIGDRLWDQRQMEISSADIA